MKQVTNKARQVTVHTKSDLYDKKKKKEVIHIFKKVTSKSYYKF
jgi:hypothetical protein